MSYSKYFLVTLPDVDPAYGAPDPMKAIVKCLRGTLDIDGKYEDYRSPSRAGCDTLLTLLCLSSLCVPQSSLGTSRATPAPMDGKTVCI